MAQNLQRFLHLKFHGKPKEQIVVSRAPDLYNLMAISTRTDYVHDLGRNFLNSVGSGAAGNLVCQ